MTSPVPPPKEATHVTVLAPQSGDVYPLMFTVAGSTDLADGQMVRVSVSEGSDAQDVPVSGEAWESGNFTRTKGPYSASGSSGGLSSGAVSFRVGPDPEIAVEGPPDIEDDPEAVKEVNRHKKKVTVRGRHNSTLGPDIDAVLLDARGKVVREHPDEKDVNNNTKKWKVVFRKVDPPGVYAVRAVRIINDQRVHTTVLVRIR